MFGFVSLFVLAFILYFFTILARYSLNSVRLSKILIKTSQNVIFNLMAIIFNLKSQHLKILS